MNSYQHEQFIVISLLLFQLKEEAYKMVKSRPRWVC